MEERGIVVEKEDGKARVRIERSEACEGCHGCLMAETGKYMIAEVVDAIGVSPGDVVRIETRSASPLGASLLLFGLPLVLLFVGYAAGAALAPILNLASSAQGIGMGAAAVFFVGAFGLVWLVNKKLTGGGQERSTIVEVLGQSQTSC